MGSLFPNKKIKKMPIIATAITTLLPLKKNKEKSNL
jgi:hypothetical protein